MYVKALEIKRQSFDAMYVLAILLSNSCPLQSTEKQTPVLIIRFAAQADGNLVCLHGPEDLA